MQKPFLDFYIQNNISPVTKKIQDNQAFFLQRDYLYRSLGLVGFIKNRKLLEFGPGNGVNAIYNYSLSPKKYVLVDGNPLAIKNIKDNFNFYFATLDNIELHHTLIEKFIHEPIYDLVIGENIITNQSCPNEFAKMISKNVKVGGALMVTCNDVVSVLPERLKALIGLLSTIHLTNFEDKASYLTNYLSPHLKALNVVGRDFKDWVIDNILHTDCSLGEKFFTFHNAIESLSGQFIFYHSSPRFFNDMRWYKSVCNFDEFRVTNSIAIECYYMNMINLLDYRQHLDPHSADLGRKIFKIAESISTLCISYFNEHTSALLTSLIEQINFLASMIDNIAPRTSLSLRTYAKIFESGQFELMQTDPSLIEWWGRGTQYVSFIKEFQEQRF